jgi:HK97 family phage portal protein
MASPTLNAKQKPSWSIRSAFKRLNPFASRIEPELYSQEQGGVKMTRYGVVKGVGGKFSEIETSNQFVIERPGANHIDPERAMANNKGYVYAAVNAIGREVQNTDFRLFQETGKDREEQTEHEALDLLDSVNSDMIGSELKYLTSAHLNLVGNCYWLLTDKAGNPVKDELTKPDAIYMLDPTRTNVVVDRTQFPHKITGYKLRLETRTIIFSPACIIHFRLPDPANPYEGKGIVQSGAEYIDNDNYAMEFNRKFFMNGARPAGFLESEAVAETQIESLKISFMDMHGGIENMNRIAVLPKGVKWVGAGATPKDMDFKNLSLVMRDRILMLFGISKTILGTAESDTNRATAETADYVFSKRVVKPHMQLICGYLNEKLIPRYGDDLYITFIDPVAEDRAARTTEMQLSVGSQPVLTINEARENFMGLGPVEGGDKLMAPTTMQPVGEPAEGGDVDPEADGPAQNDSNKTMKAANGMRVAFRPIRTKLRTRAKQRQELGGNLAKKIADALKEKLATKAFESTKEKDEAVWKEFSEYTHAAEKEITETIQKLNAEQKKEVLANLPNVTKGIDPSKLFNLDNWISITTSALTPTMETLFEHQALAAAAEIGKPDLNPFNETTRAAVKQSVQMMSESYNQTTLEALETHINEGIQAGESLADITKRVEQIYEWSDTSRAASVAKTETFRTANSALKEAWKQSGVVKTVRWYTATDPCPFCQTMEGKTIPIDDVFFKNGDSITAGDGENAKTMSLDYGDVGFPPLHVNCMCFIRPQDIAI